MLAVTPGVHITFSVGYNSLFCLHHLVYYYNIVIKLTHSNEKELGEQKTTIDKLRRDILTAKEETHQVVQQYMAYKQQAGKLSGELQASRDQEKLLNEQAKLFIKHFIYRY